MTGPDSFESLRALTLVTLALFFAPRVLPPLAPHARAIRIAALALYMLGGAILLLRRWL